MSTFRKPAGMRFSRRCLACHFAPAASVHPSVNGTDQRLCGGGDGADNLLAAQTDLLFGWRNQLSESPADGFAVRNLFKSAGGSQTRLFAQQTTQFNGVEGPKHDSRDGQQQKRAVRVRRRFARLLAFHCRRLIIFSCRLQNEQEVVGNLKLGHILKMARIQIFLPTRPFFKELSCFQRTN